VSGEILAGEKDLQSRSILDIIWARIVESIPPQADIRYGNGCLLTGGSGFARGYAATRGDIVDEGCLKSMNELELRRKTGDCVLSFLEEAGISMVSPDFQCPRISIKGPQDERFTVDGDDQLD